MAEDQRVDAERLKPSRFNQIFPPLGDVPALLFNSRTCALVALEPAEVPSIKELLARAAIEPDDPRSPDPDLLDCLRERGFLIPAVSDEMAELDVAFHWSRYRPAGIGISILPTLRCNCRCRYCFSRPVGDDMSPAVADALVERLTVLARRHPLLSVTWFGGEPLLRLDLLEALSLRLRPLFARYSAYVVTNGTLLDEATAQRLAHLGVHAVQITVDGPARFHDARRPLSSGAPTYERVLAGIRSAARCLRVDVRVNLDEELARHPAELVDFLVRLRAATGRRDAVHFSPVLYIGDRPNTVAHADLTTERFVAALAAIYERVLQEGLDIELPWIQRRLYQCGACRVGGLVVAPDGSLYRCWEEPSGVAEQPVGHLLRDALTPSERARDLDYMALTPFQYEACTQCTYLPVCMGGCPRSTLSPHRRARAVDVCERWRLYVPMIVRLRYRARKARGEARPLWRMPAGAVCAPVTRAN